MLVLITLRHMIHVHVQFILHRFFNKQCPRSGPINNYHSQMERNVISNQPIDRSFNQSISPFFDLVDTRRE